MQTEYSLVNSSKGYSQCHDFLKSNGMKHSGFTFPTIMAKREGEVIGVLGTIPLKNVVVAGPLWVSVAGNGSFVAIRIIEAYDNVMRNAGLTMYYFSVEKDNPKWLSLIRKMDTEELDDNDPELFWFKRTLQ